MKTILIVAIAVTVAATGAVADTLSVAWGDTLNGDLVEIADATVLFRTRIAGQVVVPLAKVVSLETASLRRITFDDQRSVVARFLRKDKQTFIALASGAVEGPIDLTRIVHAGPVSETTALRSESPALTDAPASSLSGDWQVGVLQRWGNLEYTAPVTRLTLRNDADQYHFVSNMLLELADQDQFPRLVDALAEWRFRPGDSLQPTFDIHVERDIDAALSLRGALTLGLRRELLASPSTDFAVGAGLNLAVEHYNTERLWRAGDADLQSRLLGDDPRWAVVDPFASADADLRRSLRRVTSLGYYADDVRSRKEELNLRLNLSLKRAFARGATLAEEIYLYPGLSDFGDFRARSESYLHVPLSSQLNLRLHLRLDYDDQFRNLDNWRASAGAMLGLDF